MNALPSRCLGTESHVSPAQETFFSDFSACSLASLKVKPSRSNFSKPPTDTKKISYHQLTRFPPPSKVSVPRDLYHILINLHIICYIFFSSKLNYEDSLRRVQISRIFVDILSEFLLVLKSFQEETRTSYLSLRPFRNLF